MKVKIKCRTCDSADGQKSDKAHQVKVRIIKAPLVDSTQLRSIILQRAGALVL